MQTILVTGAGSGIGRVTARLFLDQGWRVGLAGRRKTPLEETAGGHENALVLPLDVTDPNAVDAGFAQLADKWGHLDVLFNNAGVSLPTYMIDDIPVDEWNTLSNINISGMFLCARAAFGMMRRQDPQGGRIINNGSVSAQTPRLGAAPYTATKHAITGLTKTIALDGRDLNICCGQIDIGNAHTDMVENLIRAGEMVETMAVSDAAQAVWNMAQLPLTTNVLSMTIMANKMPFVGRG